MISISLYTSSKAVVKFYRKLLRRPEDFADERLSELEVCVKLLMKLRCFFRYGFT